LVGKGDVLSQDLAKTNRSALGDITLADIYIVFH
jgi:hypothetical protein